MPIHDEAIKELYKELSQFRVQHDYRGNALKNEFWGVKESELVSAEKCMGIQIPCELRNFYATVGYGHLVTSRAGVSQGDYFNIFVDLPRLCNLWLREEVSFQYDAELVDEGELPFFDIGSYSYLVLRPYSTAPNAVYRPYDQKPIAGSFDEFVLRLYQDTIFYLSHEGVYDL